MGRRGPPKKPTELRVLQGCNGHIPLNKDEPKPKAVQGVKAPLFLTKGGKKIWKREAPKIEKLGLLSEIDLNAFARYCDLMDKWLRVKSKIDRLDDFYYPIYFDQTDEEKAAKKEPRIKYFATYPEVSLYNTLATQLNRLEREFGLTPAARSAISLKPTTEQKEKTRKFLYGNE
jgi:P27 family predicted phage terminase small subunit